MANERPEADQANDAAGGDRTAGPDKRRNAAIGRNDAPVRTEHSVKATEHDKTGNAAGTDKQRPNSSGRRSRSRHRPQHNARAETSSGSDASTHPGASVRSRKVDGSGAAVSPNSSERGVSGRPAGRRAEKNMSSLRWTWGDYALQLSVVIIGIMVTFIGSDLISGWSRQRQVQTVMQLVADELEKNREQLREVCMSLRYDQQGMLMLMQYDMDVEAVPLDSLKHYRYIMSRLHAYHPYQDVLEVLKSSDVVSAVQDKQLLVDIFGCYNRLNDFCEQVLLYSDRKREAQTHLSTNDSGFTIGGSDQRASWRGYMADPMCAAFFGTSAYFFGFDNNFDKRIEAVDDTIGRIKDKYGFQ